MATQEANGHEAVVRHHQERVKSTIVNKSLDGSLLARKADERAKQLSKLMQYEQVLI